VFLFGNEFFLLKNKFQQFNFFENLNDLKNSLPQKGVFLLKGSRKNKLELIILEETK
jgi:UDP-N-acetylmuramyl pentapeptide synthase